jgi:LacI family transcriptional regulator
MIGGYDRYQGYLRALEEYGIPLCPELVIEGDYSEGSGHDAMLKLLAAKPDAVFAASDMMAIGALWALHEANVRVPEDIAVVGYDDVPLAGKTEPPLTTVRQPIQKLGSTAVKTLIDVIRHPRNEARHVMVDTELVIRKSCGATLNAALNR